jgi:hypothetical protein
MSGVIEKWFHLFHEINQSGFLITDFLLGNYAVGKRSTERCQPLCVVVNQRLVGIGIHPASARHDNILLNYV